LKLGDDPSRWNEEDFGDISRRRTDSAEGDTDAREGGGGVDSE
jgi:hypothetical protein